MMAENWPFKRWVIIRCELCGKDATKMVASLMDVTWECDDCIRNTSAGPIRKYTSSTSATRQTSPNLPSSSTRDTFWNDDRMVTVLCEQCKQEITRSIEYFRKRFCWKCKQCSRKSAVRRNKKTFPATMTSQSTSPLASTSESIALSSPPAKRCMDAIPIVDMRFSPINNKAGSIEKMGNPYHRTTPMHWLTALNGNSNSNRLVNDEDAEIPGNESAGVTEPTALSTAVDMDLDRSSILQNLLLDEICPLPYLRNEPFRLSDEEDISLDSNPSTNAN